MNRSISHAKVRLRSARVKVQRRGAIRNVQIDRKIPANLCGTFRNRLVDIAIPAELAAGISVAYSMQCSAFGVRMVQALQGGGLCIEATGLKFPFHSLSSNS